MKALRIAVAMSFCLAIVIFGSSVAYCAERMAVKSNVANIRSGPGTQYERIWQVEKYHPLNIIEKKGEWYRVQDFEGDKGWVHSSLLDKTKSVIIKVDRCNVRSGPGTQFDIVFTVDKGIPFKVLQKKGRWYEVQHADGDRGWILNTLLW